MGSNLDHNKILRGIRVDSCGAESDSDSQPFQHPTVGKTGIPWSLEEQTEGARELLRNVTWSGLMDYFLLSLENDGVLMGAELPFIDWDMHELLAIRGMMVDGGACCGGSMTF